MLQISYDSLLLGSDYDLNAGRQIPIDILEQVEKRAFFFLKTLESTRTPPLRLLAELQKLSPDDPINDLIRRMMAAQYPMAALLLVPDGSWDPDAIKNSLLHTYHEIAQKETATEGEAFGWAVCCRATQNFGLKPADCAEQWLADFAMRLKEGRKLDEPGPEIAFHLAFRWGCAALDVWPQPSHGAGNVHWKVSASGRDQFMTGWAKGLVPAPCWRAAVWLAKKKPSLWGSFLENLVGVRLTPTQPTQPFAALPAPRGAEHFVALVGPAGAGKTSFLCSLAEDEAQGLEYQVVQGNAWREITREDSPRREWHANQTFNTQTGQQFNLRGAEKGIPGGIRLLAHDVAGERLEDETDGLIEFERFCDRCPPSALVVFVGRYPERAAIVCEKLKNFAAQKNLRDLPVLLLFGFADEYLKEGENVLRQKLLGPDAISCETGKLLGGRAKRGVNNLISAMEESEFWAEHPHEALAYEDKLVTFQPALEHILSSFSQVRLGFGCTLGGSGQPRASTSKHWQALRHRILAQVSVSTKRALATAFYSEVANRHAELEWVRCFGDRLGALRLPNVVPEKDSLERLRKDLASCSEELLDEIEAEFSSLVQSLPKLGVWDLGLKVDGRGPLQLFDWLFRSLGIPTEVALQDLMERAPSKEAIERGKWGPAGWEGNLEFYCDWRTGAVTVPCELSNGDSAAVLKELKIKCGLGPGDPVSRLIACCVEKVGTSPQGAEENPQNDEKKSGLRELISALTHAADDRGAFPELSFRPGDSDPHAFAVLSSGGARFEEFAAVACCQHHLLQILEATAKWLTFLKEHPGVDLARTLTVAYFLQMRRVDKNGSRLDREDISEWDTLWKRYSAASNTLNRRLLSLNKGGFIRGTDLTAWLNGTAIEGPALEAAVDFGRALVQMANDRLAGMLRAKLAYAHHSGWFGEPKLIESLKAYLEKEAFDPWKAFGGQLQANRKNYQEIFSPLLSALPPGATR